MKRFHVKARAEAADMALLDEGQTTCCHARCEKHWVTDPRGIAWEHFHTRANIPVFHEAQATAAPVRGKPVAIAVKAAGACC